jgi:hypothetical protein
VKASKYPCQNQETGGTNNELAVLELNIGPCFLQLIGDALGVDQATEYVLRSGGGPPQRSLDFYQPTIARQSERWCAFL